MAKRHWAICLGILHPGQDRFQGLIPSRFDEKVPDSEKPLDKVCLKEISVILSKGMAFELLTNIPVLISIRSGKINKGSWQ